MSRTVACKENGVQKFKTVLTACAMVLAFVGVASANAGVEDEGLPWGNFLLRVVNILIFLGIIWYAAGKIIKKFFVGRRASIVTEMEELDRLKKEAAAHLAEVERRVAGVEAECRALLEEGRAQAESLKAAILAEAEKQAAQIVEQARRSAEQEGKAELDAIRARMADDIVAAVEKGLVERLDAAEQQKLIDNSLTKVVLQ